MGMKTPAESSRADAASRGDTRIGRPSDPTIDALVLASALDLIAERDYERMTIEEVASRTGKAKTTLYRRWATKEELVLAVIGAIGRPPEVVSPPDRGSLRDDLLAVIDSPWLGGPERRSAVFAGLTSASRSSTRLAAAVRQEVTEPYVEIYRRLYERAAVRGEVAKGFLRSIPVMADVIPALSTHRLATGEPVDRDYFVSVIDKVVLAALGLSPR
jgi:AcrR family transcriptional regulator